MKPRRIVVTGMGIVSPLGCEVERVWRRLLAGQSGLRRLPEELIASLPAKIGGVVPTKEEYKKAGFDPDQFLHLRKIRKNLICRNTRCKHFEDVGNTNSHAANARASATFSELIRDSFRIAIPFNRLANHTTKKRRPKAPFGRSLETHQLDFDGFRSAACTHPMVLTPFALDLSKRLNRHLCFDKPA